jgi:hypothetical protein
MLMMVSKEEMLQIMVICKAALIWGIQIVELEPIPDFLIYQETLSILKYYPLS